MVLKLKLTKKQRIKLIIVESANDLLETVKQLLTESFIDLFIHSMAVSDYTVDYVCTSKMLAENITGNVFNIIEDIENSINNNMNRFEQNSKLSSKQSDLIIKLKPTPKIISYIKKLSPKTYLVGFKLLTGVSEQELKKVAYNLLQKNDCNLVIANDIKNINDSGHKAFLIDANKNTIPANTKQDIAKKLIRKIGEVL